ncbi:Serine/threonine-protein phosphatase 7 long form homolog [Linum perenne]
MFLCAYSLQGQQRSLHCRRATTLPPYNELYTPHLRTVGLYGVHELVRMRLDHDLITALIERWRPETHTFHMPEGECTVTLQDVNIISGLPINGRAITGRVSGQWIQMIYDFLGHQLDVESTDIKGSQLKLRWLNETFNALPPNPTPFDVQRYARAYMLCLIGGFLFPNKSTQYVHLMWLPLLRDFTSAGGLSWGSACLAWLYREMCRASHVVAEQISGPLFILQIWAWEHFPFIARTPSYTIPWDIEEFQHMPYGARYVLLSQFNVYTCTHLFVVLLTKISRNGVDGSKGEMRVNKPSITWRCIVTSSID